MTTLSSTRGPALAAESSRGLPLIAAPLRAAGKKLLHTAIDHITIGGLTVIDGDTTHRSPSADGTHPTVHIHNPSFYAAAAFGGSIGIAESYMDGHWTTNDLPGLIETITVNTTAMDTIESPLTRILAPFTAAAYWLERNTRAGSRKNIAAHYDLGNDFFALFLDESMTYSAGVFEMPTDSLAQSQVNKIDRACRALGLTQDDHLLEIGTGWGALAIHAATNYGCRVTTTTISQRQHDEARRRINAAGLGHRITLLKTDYRDLTGKFDKLVSIEMVEAVGRDNIPRFFKACSDLLKPDGAAFIQAITIRDQYFKSAARTRDFLKKYIFPGSCLLGSSAILEATTRNTDLRLWAMTDIAPHYVTTLQLWREAFHARLCEVRAQGFDERFIRMWDFYFAYCEGAFRARHVGDVQMLLTKPMCRLPATALAFTDPAPAASTPRATSPVVTPAARTPASQGCPA